MPTKALVDDEGSTCVLDRRASSAAADKPAAAQARPPCPPRRNNIGTMTYTLVQALDLSASRKRAHPSTVLNGAGSNAPIDLLVIILSLSADLHAVGRGPATGELLVTDQSLPLGCCGRIQLYGRENIKMLSEVGRGDVVRFNRVDVSKDNRNDASMHATSNEAPWGTATGTTALSTIICEMRPSWSDPEAGVPFARVGIGASAYRSPGNEIVDGDDTSSLGEVVDPHALPNSMITPPSVIEELLRWFQKYYHAGVSNGGGSVLSLSISGTATTGVGPCRRRRLRDITNPNLLSEMVVNVIHCDASAILSPAAALSLSGSAGKRRGKAASVSQQRGYVATLSDGHDASDIMPLYDCHRFKVILESSVSSDSKRRGRLLITNVLSRRLATSSASAFASCSSSMILLPTPDTKIVSLPDDSATGTCTAAATGSAFANVPSSTKAARAATYTLTSQFWDSQSQMLTSSPGQQGLRSPLGRGVSEDYETKIVTSQILDIFIDDCNQCLSDEQVLADPDNLASILVPSFTSRKTAKCTNTESTSQYRNATITIDFTSAGKESFVVKASGNIMQTLCCSCPAADLMEGKNDMEVARSSVRDILRGFIHLDVPLEWTLRKKKETETGRWTVVDVALPTILVTMPQ